MHLRTEGTAFLAQFELCDPRALVARRLAPLILQAFADPDERIAAFDSLAAGTLTIGEVRQSHLAVYDPPALATLKDIAKLSEGAIVRSTLEHERLQRHLAYAPAAHLVVPEAARPVPEAGEARDCVVIYAPENAAGDVALLQFALQELRREVVVVADGDDGAAAFARAAVVVDATLEHAGNSIELARRGYTVVGASSAAAYEYVDGVLTYEPWNHRSVFATVSTALGRPPSSVRAMQVATLAPPPPVLDGPLVSIVVRTFNRPAFLQRALESLRAQTYLNIEIVVVNDAGSDVANVVAGFANAKYVALKENKGTSGAGNAGIAHATGELIGFLDDDDVVFPDHVSSLVAAIVQNGADVAHTDTIAAHYERETGGAYRASGYNVFLDRLVEPTDFYVTDAIGPMSVLMRKSVLSAAGGFDESLTHAEDWELFLKLSAQYDFIHVPRITGVYSIRHDGSHMMSGAGEKVAAALQRLMELHPLPHRPVMEAARRQALDAYAKAGYEMRFPAPALKR